MDSSNSNEVKVSLIKGNEVSEEVIENEIPKATKVSLIKGNEISEDVVENEIPKATKVSLIKGNEISEDDIENEMSKEIKVSLTKGNEISEEVIETEIPTETKVSLTKGNEISEDDIENEMSKEIKVSLTKGNEISEDDIEDEIPKASKVSLGKGNEVSEEVVENEISKETKVSLGKGNEVSEPVIDEVNTDDTKIKPEDDVIEMYTAGTNKAGSASGAAGMPANPGQKSYLSSSASSANRNAPAAMKKSRIDSYLDDDDDYKRNILSSNSPVPVVESGRRSTHIIPVLVALIILLCIGMLLVLLNINKLKNNSVQTLDKGNKEENVTPVVSQNIENESNNAAAVVTEKAAERAESVTAASEKVTEPVVTEPLVLEESNEMAEVGAGSDSSRKAIMNCLPELYDELSSNSGIVFDNEKFDSNNFSICDIDSDGEAELLVKITTGPMAAKALYIYKADSSGKAVKEGSMSYLSEFYQNGYVKSPLNHNQGKGSLWPYTVEKHNPLADTYDSYYSLDSWDKALSSEGFPSDIDVSSTGVVYYINNYVSGEKLTCDYSDYVKWFNTWNQCSPKLNIKYEAFSEDNVRKYVPDFHKQETHSYLGKGYVATVDDVLNLRQEPTTNSKVLTTLPKNTKLELYSSDDSGWYFTKYQGVEGYVSADWVAFGDPPSVKPNEIYSLSPYLTGQISSGGLQIEGYTTDYVCYGGTKTVHWICEDTWHITARRRTYSYGVEWYECWDTDDGDYYGWIDGKFLYFYRR